MKKKSKKISLSLASVLIIGLVGLFALNFVTASIGGIWGMIADRAGFYLASGVGQPPQDSDTSIGGTQYNRQIDFAEGISVDGTEIIDTYGKRVVSNVQLALSFPATTTHTFTPIVRYDNPHDYSLVVEKWYVDLTTALGSMTGEVSCGTTTKDLSGSLVATSSKTLLSEWFISKTAINGKASDDFLTASNATSTDLIGTYFGTIGDNRVPTSSMFILPASTSFVCSFAPATKGTSSSDWTTTGNFTGAGKLHLETRKR